MVGAPIRGPVALRGLLPHPPVDVLVPAKVVQLGELAAARAANVRPLLGVCPEVAG